MRPRTILTVRATDANGRVEWLARDLSVDGPYGVGATPEEAKGDLERALEFWRGATEWGAGTQSYTTGTGCKPLVLHFEVAGAWRQTVPGGSTVTVP